METSVAADPQQRAVRRLAGVGEWGPGEEVLAPSVRNAELLGQP